MSLMLRSLWSAGYETNDRFFALWRDQHWRTGQGICTMDMALSGSYRESALMGCPYTSRMYDGRSDDAASSVRYGVFFSRLLKNPPQAITVGRGRQTTLLRRIDFERRAVSGMVCRTNCMDINGCNRRINDMGRRLGRASRRPKGGCGRD